jgi:hypothetical protein
MFPFHSGDPTEDVYAFLIYTEGATSPSHIILLHVITLTTSEVVLKNHSISKSYLTFRNSSLSSPLAVISS